MREMHANSCLIASGSPVSNDIAVKYLFVLHWDGTRGLLFVHTSNNKAAHESLAKAVCGDDVELVKGSEVFRVFSGLKQLLLQTVNVMGLVYEEMGEQFGADTLMLF